MEVFLAEPVLDAAFEAGLLDAAAGRGAPASAAGFALGHDPGGPRVALVAEPGATARGALVEADAERLARLDFVMGALGGAARDVPVRLATGAAQTARAHLADDHGDGDHGDGAGAPAAGPSPDPGFLREIMLEVAGHFGRTGPERMARLMHGIGFRALARQRGRAMRTPVLLRSGLGGADVELLEATYPYADYFGVERLRLRHRRFDGGWSPPLLRAVLTSGDAVTVVPFDPVAGTVLLIEQFRAGAYARRDPQPWFLEAIAGRCDGPESTGDAARREAREEAGLELGRMEQIAAYYPTPGIAAEYITAFVGEADLSDAGGLHGLEAENEDIRALVVPLAEARAATERGEINNAPLLLSLLWLELHHRRLAEAWRTPGRSA